MKRTLFAALIAIVMVLTTFGSCVIATKSNTTTLCGHIYDEDTNNIISGAVISAMEYNITVYSDENGYYSIDFGGYVSMATISIVATGYQPLEEILVLIPGQPNTHDFLLLQWNVGITLSDGNVDPEQDYRPTFPFFTVRYFNSNGYDPTVKNVIIDGEVHDMSYWYGYIYRCDSVNPYIVPGVHQFHFYFEDQYGGHGRYPESGTLTFTVLNRNPTLTKGGAVQKDSKYLWATDPPIVLKGKTVEFFVNYDDLMDQDAPVVKNLVLDGNAYDMTKVTWTSFPYFSSYYCDISSHDLKLGIHHFYFYYEDQWGGSARYPESGTLTFIVIWWPNSFNSHAQSHSSPQSQGSSSSPQANPSPNQQTSHSSQQITQLHQMMIKTTKK